MSQINSSKTKFKFTEENNKLVSKIINQYPKGRQKSAILPLFHLAQNQQGFLTKEAIVEVAELLSIPYIKAYEVASFYSMFNLDPVGKYHIQVCSTTPCWLNGSSKISKACQRRLKIENRKTTKDKKFTLSEIECLGACIDAPVALINNDRYEKLTEEKIIHIIDKLDEDD